jgi:hypothetical protein
VSFTQGGARSSLTLGYFLIVLSGLQPGSKGLSPSGLPYLDPRDGRLTTEVLWSGANGTPPAEKKWVPEPADSSTQKWDTSAQDKERLHINSYTQYYEHLLP